MEENDGNSNKKWRREKKNEFSKKFFRYLPAMSGGGNLLGNAVGNRMWGINYRI